MKRDIEIIENALLNLDEKISKFICDIYDSDLPVCDNNIINNLEETQKEVADMWQNMQIMKNIIKKAEFLVIKSKIEKCNNE